MEARLLDIEAVVARLKLERFAIVGLIHGAPAAIAYTARHPEAVSHLILGSGYVSGREYLEAISDLPMRDEDWERYTLNQANWTLDFTNSEFAPVVAALFRESMTLEAVRACVAAMDAIDVRSLLPLILAPALVMYRQRAFNVSLPESSRELASKIPDARFVEIAKRADPRWSAEETRIVEAFLGVNQDALAPNRTDATPSRIGTASAFRMILFTDIVGHTEMMQRLGDAKGRDVLREHERITRETLKAHGGAEIKTMGDGFMASFGSVTSALECAIALQRAFASHSASMPEPLHVRVGLNAGEPIEEDGDLFGSTVILASRIAAQAGAGEILIPEPVRHLLSGKSFVYADRGEFAMKGFDDAVRLYEVRWRE
jgi:class 3 adenylate cyclase